MPDTQLKTSDFYLAAYFKAIGVSLLRSDEMNGKICFVFEKKVNTNALVNEFYDSRAMVNARHYQAAIKDLKSIIHDKANFER